MLLAGLVPAVPALAPTAGGAVPSSPSAAGVTFGIEGEVYATARVGDIVYLGGRFDLVLGQPRHNLAAVDVSTGTLTDWNPTPAGDELPEVGVRALVASPDGSTIYVGGDFTSLAGAPRAGLAAVTAAGSVTDWNPEPNDVVLALAVDPSGSPVYVGGTFSKLGTADRSSLGAVSATGSVTDWDPGAPGGVLALVVDGTGATVYAGGAFSMLGGASRAHVGAVSTATGVATDWDVGADDTVRSLDLAPNGEWLYVGGQFTSLGAFPRAGLGAVSTPGTGAVTSWDPGVTAANEDPKVLALRVDAADGLVYVAGRFDTLGGEARTNLGAVSSGGGTVTAWDPDPTPEWRGRGHGNVFTLSLDESSESLLAGGRFEAVRGVPRDSFAEISTAGEGATTDVDVPVDYTASVESLARHGSLLYVGGNFTRAGAEPRRNVAAIDLTTHEVTPWAPRVTLDEPVPPMRQPSVSAIAVSPSGARVYLGGRFDHVNGSGRINLAAVSAAGTGPVVGWQLAAPDTADGGGVSALAVEPSGSRVYVGGGFSTIGGQPRAGLAAVTTGGAGTVTDWDPALVGTPVPEVSALALDPAGGRLFAAGSFAAVGGASRENLAAITTGAGTATGWAPDAGGRVRALVLDAGNRVLYVGGRFGFLGSETRRGLGAVSTTGPGATTAWDPNAGGAVGDDVTAMALSADRSELFAAGVSVGVARQKSFSTAGMGAMTAWSPVVDRPVVALTTTEDGSVFAGSTFNETGITTEPALAEFVPSAVRVPPVVSIGDGAVVEGAGGEQHLRLTVSLSRPADVPVSVYARTTTGPATAGTDYEPTAGWVTIPAGATSAPVTLTIRGDTNVETTEFVRVQLSDPAAARLGRAIGIASILDGDPSPVRRVSIGNAAVVEGDAGTRSARFEVSLSRTYAKPVTVRYETATGTAGGSDFTTAHGTAVIPAGEHSVTVRVAVAADQVAEPTETFSVRLSAPTNAGLGRARGAGRILDDDS